MHGRRAGAAGRMVLLGAIAGMDLIENWMRRRPRSSTTPSSRPNASRPALEAGLVNAVLRRAAPGLRETPALDTAAGVVEELAVYFSHPTWLVRSPTLQPTYKLAKAGHVRPPMRWCCGGAHGRAGADSVASASSARDGHWGDIQPALAAGHCYLQDPGYAPRPDAGATGCGRELAGIVRRARRQDAAARGPDGAGADRGRRPRGRADETFRGEHRPLA